LNGIEHDYQMLGLEPGASGVEIKQAYRDLVIVWHPDRFSGNSRLQKVATEKLKEINLAYKKLMEYVENSWCENLFGFEDEEFTREDGDSADAQPNSQNPETPDWFEEGGEFTIKDGDSADAQPNSQNPETPDRPEKEKEFTMEGGHAADAQLNSEDPETRDWLDSGYDSLKHGRLEEAISCFDKALEINPRLAKTWTTKGLILEKLGKLQEGLECFERALEIDQRHEDSWVAKGNILYSLFKNQEALDCYDHALAINPKNAEVWYRRWVTLQRVEKFQKIPDSIGEALEMDQASGGAWYYQKAFGSEELQHTFSYRRPYLLGAETERSWHMPNDLIGDLSEVRLFNIVKALVDGRKSGMVSIEGKDAAELYIQGGLIVHGKINTLVGEEAILAIMDLNEGRVRFNWQLSPEKQTVRRSTEQLISIWAQREDEWRKVRKVMTSSNDIFSIVVDSGGKDRTIPAEQWGVLALCNGMRTVSEIIHALNWDEFKTIDTIYQLVKAGLLEKVEAPQPLKKKLIGKDFFPALERELRKVIGPIAPIIIEKKLMEFGDTKDSLPFDHALAFIETVGEEIPDDQGREEFKKEVIKFFSL